MVLPVMSKFYVISGIENCLMGMEMAKVGVPVVIEACP